MQPALHAEQRPVIHAFARDVFKIEISALGAVGKSLKRGRHAPGVKSAVAGVASPGPQADCRKTVIPHTVAMRLKAIGASALRANHREIAPSFVRRIHKSLVLSKSQRFRSAALHV
jgi:hypothetical protein